MTTPIDGTSLSGAYLVLQAELGRLVDCADFTADSGAAFFDAVWERVQRDIVRKRPGLTSSDITDPTELEHACHLAALHQLYILSDLEEDRVQARRWLSEYQKELAEVQLTTSGGSTAGEGEQTLMVRG